MKKSSGNGFKVLIMTICILLVVALVTAGNSTVNGLFTGFILTPLQRVAADAAGDIGQTVQPPEDAEKLAEENSKLKEDNRKLNDMLVDYYDLKKENEELYKFYNIKKENQDFALVPATVISRDPNENFYGFVLDKGSAEGIELNDPVMTENGLAGYVSEVSLRSCKVTAILSPAAQVGAMDKKSEDEGIVTGDPEYSDSGTIILKNISAQNDIKTGDIVVTSGYGGMYPKNIKIGTVSKITYDSFTGMPMALVKPFEDVRDITSAAIVTNFSGKGEIEVYTEESSGSKNSQKSKSD